MRNTRFAVALRRAHASGRPVLLGIEIVAVAIVACAAVWSATSSSPAVSIAVSLVVSVALVVIASLAVPDDAPPAPSWFASQRAAQRQRRDFRA